MSISAMHRLKKITVHFGETGCKKMFIKLRLTQRELGTFLATCMNEKFCIILADKNMPDVKLQDQHGVLEFPRTG